MGKTLFDKIWERHIVKEISDGPTVISIDRHLIHEVTSPQAFSMIESKGYPVRCPEKTFATCDHNVPTVGQERFLSGFGSNDPAAVEAVSALAKNTEHYGIRYFPLGSQGNGIVHVIAPEQGIVLCGETVVCGDSHTATHGAFGNIAFGIGTSEVAMVFASQCLMQVKPAQTRIEVTGHLRSGVSAKDLILYIISQLGTSGCTGTFVEYCGEAVRGLSMEGRMAVCNMSIEMGARGGLIAPDETTFRYLRGRSFAPAGASFERLVAQWRGLYSDSDAVFDRSFSFRGEDVPVMVTHGTNPGMGMPLDGAIPSCAVGCDDSGFAKALGYMGFKVGEQMIGKKVDYVFLGSCTNGRIEDFREFASVVRGRRKSPWVTAWLVPGSKAVEAAIEAEGLGDILREAGFEVRQPGCSACLAMNADKVPSGCLCVSTSNRNFEGRQGAGARTVLASPATAACAAVTGMVSGLDSLKKVPVSETSVRRSVRVFAPATVANMGCGFDIMGMTLDDEGDVLRVEMSEGDGLEIINETDVSLPDNLDENVITPAVRAFMKDYGSRRHIVIHVEKKIFPGSGIGSSAASSAAAVYAVNELLGRPFSPERLVEFAMEGEKLISGGVSHADNVGPAILGGVVLLRGYEPLDVVRLPVPSNFFCSVVHPAIVVSTKEARKVLPAEIPLRKAVEQWGNVAGLVAGLSLGDMDLIGRAMKDVVVEPYRKGFIPGFDELRDAVIGAGALAMNISGAGPSVFAISKDMSTAQKVADVMRSHFSERNISSDVFAMNVSNVGTRVINWE